MERISKTRNIKYQGAFPDEERPAGGTRLRAVWLAPSAVPMAVLVTPPRAGPASAEGS